VVENQIESSNLPQTIEEAVCSSGPCSEPAVADFDAKRLCTEHFLAACFQELEARNDRLKSEPADSEIVSFRKFLSSSVEQAQRISDGPHNVDKETKTQLLEFLLRASELSKRIRRSPRLTSSVPVWLRREDPARTWEEETWTVTTSRHGAGLTKVAARRHAWFIASTMATAADKSGLNFWIATTSGISCRNTLPAITATESNFSPLGKNCLIDPQWDGLRLAVRFSVQAVGAAEWIRTTTLLRAPAPQAGASANSATAAIWGYF
jgi:hypothetical protein